jgi:hypothetical protein
VPSSDLVDPSLAIAQLAAELLDREIPAFFRTPAEAADNVLVGARTLARCRRFLNQ